MDGGVGGRAAVDRYCCQRTRRRSNRLVRVHGDRHAATQPDVLDAWLLGKRKLDIDRRGGWIVCEHLDREQGNEPEIEFKKQLCIVPA